MFIQRCTRLSVKHYNTFNIERPLRIYILTMSQLNCITNCVATDLEQFWYSEVWTKELTKRTSRCK